MERMRLNIGNAVRIAGGSGRRAGRTAARPGRAQILCVSVQRACRFHTGTIQWYPKIRTGVVRAVTSAHAIYSQAQSEENPPRRCNGAEIPCPAQRVRPGPVPPSGPAGQAVRPDGTMGDEYSGVGAIPNRR